MALHRELNAQMDIRITEPVFFLGSQRRVGEVIRDVEDGPYRTQLSQTVSPANPGGLTRIPQFVEMPEEIKTTIENAAAAGTPAPVTAVPVVDSLPPAPTPAPGTFGDALASIQKPAPKPAAAPSSGSPAWQLAALTARRRKLNGAIGNEVQAYGKRLAELENKMPQVFGKANAKLDDEMTHLGDLDTSLTDFANSTGEDPL